MLVQALGKHENIETKGDDAGGEDEESDPVGLAGEIEAALHAAMAKKETYLGQARSVLYNLKDAKNPTFRFKLVVGFFNPADVPRLSAEDMASDEKNAERAAQRKFAMEAIQSDWASSGSAVCSLAESARGPGRHISRCRPAPPMSL